MCNRFTSIAPQIEIERRFEVQEAFYQTQPNFNISPRSNVAAVIQQETRQLHGMRWSLSLPWSKGKSPGEKSYVLTNVRRESLQEKAYFQKMFERNRCVIPASGFYEWKKVGSEKIPHYFQLKSQELFGFAGVYRLERLKNEKQELTCAIITTEANDVVNPIHPRMPVILKPNYEKEWLDSTQETNNLQFCLDAYPAEQMEGYMVSRRMNSPKFNSPKCIQPYPQSHKQKTSLVDFF
ncbi:MAG: SOS response-associated peptidase [Promethearchaeota archaeon]